MIEDSGKVNESAEKFVAIGIANELTDLRYSKGKLYFDPGRYITRGDLAVLIYNAYQKKELAKVAAPTWENTKISWLPVEHATKYEVNLYKDETLVRTITVTEGSNSYDFIKTIGINPGSYKATVQAKASNSLLDGPVSDPAARTFALSDFKLKDGEGITVTTDPVKKTHTITIDASKLPARLPKTFRICPILDDIRPSIQSRIRQRTIRNTSWTALRSLAGQENTTGLMVETRNIPYCCFLTMIWIFWAITPVRTR